MPTQYAERRRRLILAGIAGFVGALPAAAQTCRPTSRDQLGPFYTRNAPELTELCASGSGGKERLIVSGRILGADCKPLAGALIEVWHADAGGEYSGFGTLARGKKEDPACLLRTSLNADAEGRYRFSTIVPAEYPGRPRHLHYRVSHPAHATLVTQLYFGRERGIPDDLMVALQRDDKGVTRAAFDLTLARMG